MRISHEAIYQALYIQGCGATLGLGQGVMPGLSVRRANSPPDSLLTLLTLQNVIKAAQDVHGTSSTALGRIGKDDHRGDSANQPRSSRVSAQR